MAEAGACTVAVVEAGIVVVVDTVVVVGIGVGAEAEAGVSGSRVHCTEEVVGIEVEVPLAGWLVVVGVFRHQLP